jgi:hypothetical protein
MAVLGLLAVHQDSAKTLAVVMLHYTSVGYVCFNFKRDIGQRLKLKSQRLLAAHHSNKEVGQRN